jgi:hypothetical protein
VVVQTHITVTTTPLIGVIIDTFFNGSDKSNKGCYMISWIERCSYMVMKVKGDKQQKV